MHSPLHITVEYVVSYSILADIFISLADNYILSTTSVDHRLISDAILTMGHMAKHLAWGAYFVLVQNYLKLLRTKNESERVYIHMQVTVLDDFHFLMEKVVSEADQSKEDEEEDEGTEEGVEE
jgi:U3 small nucleolar RNA-associated protein 20